MFPSICVALGCEEPAALLKAAEQEAERGETFFEFRLDHLRKPQEGPAAIRRFLAGRPEATVLATCRRRRNHGAFDGSTAEQVGVLEAAAEAGAQFLDLEIESAEERPAACTALRSRARLIISYHNFESTPAMEAALRRLMRHQADAYKLAVTARKPSDIHRALALARTNPRRRIIVFAMGEVGIPSRVLNLVYGSQFTFAASSSAAATAPGQIEAQQLRRIYHVEKLTSSSRIYGVIADPVGHSLSPAVHNRAFQARRVDAVYVPFRVGATQLRDFMTLAEKLPVSGFSVTIPHKQRILRYLDAVDPLARRIGAVNTVWRKAGKWRGMNADAPAVIASLKPHVKLSGATVLIVGSGGAARAAAFALTDAGARISIVGIEPDQVRALARAAGGEALAAEKLAGRRFDILVHATPLGMYPRVEECYFKDYIPADVVMDMVYNPLETKLLRMAREQGKVTVAGIEMFLDQAARQFEVWTGESAPRAVMERVALEALGVRQNGQAAR